MQAKQVLRFMVISLILHLPFAAFANTTTLAVASNFKSTAQQLKMVFEQQYPYQVRIVSASSGKLYAQILQQAPFDIFLSADQQKTGLLIEQGLVQNNQAFTYAIGRLVLWSANNALDVKTCLLQHCYSRLAMANPHYAPYGLAAQETLKALSLTVQPQDIVMGENINQTLQFIQTGNVELGFIAASQLSLIGAANTSSINIWPIPDAHHSAIKQDAVSLKRSKDNPAAKAFWQFLQQQTAQAIITSAGYQTLPGTAQ